MFVRLLFILIWIGNSCATSKLSNTHTRRHDRRTQLDYSSTKDKLNLNELRLLEKYDNILTAINDDNKSETTKKRNVEEKRVSASSGGEMTVPTKKREFVEFTNDNDGIAWRKSNKDSKGLLPEREISEEQGEEMRPQDFESTGSYAGDGEKWEFYKQMNDWIDKGERIFQSSDNRLYQDSTNAVDDKKTNMADENDAQGNDLDTDDSEDREEKKSMKKEVEEDFTDYENNISHWPKEVKSENYDNNKHWSNDGDEFFANDFENKNEDEANHIRVLLDGDGDKTLRDEKHGDDVMENGFQVEGDKKSLEEDHTLVDEKYTSEEHKKNIKGHPNNIKHHKAAIDRPWIKHSFAHGEKDNNKNKDSRFVNSAILFWIPKKKKDMNQRSQMKRGQVKQASEMSLTRKRGNRDDKTIGENIEDRHMISAKQISGSKDSSMTNEEKYINQEKADGSWKDRYEEMVKRSFDDTNTMKQEMRKRQAKDSRENSKIGSEMEDVNQYHTDDSNVAKRGMKRCLWGPCTEDELFEQDSDERSRNEEHTNKRSLMIQREVQERK